MTTVDSSNYGYENGSASKGHPYSTDCSSTFQYGTYYSTEELGTKLHTAAQSGNKRSVKKIIQRGNTFFLAQFVCINAIFQNVLSNKKCYG